LQPVLGQEAGQAGDRPARGLDPRRRHHAAGRAAQGRRARRADHADVVSALARSADDAGHRADARRRVPDRERRDRAAGEQLPVQRVADPDAEPVRRAVARRAHRGPRARPRAADGRLQPGVDLGGGLMEGAVVVTADRAVTGVAGAGVRGATAVLAIEGAIAAVGAPEAVLADPRAAGARRIEWARRAMVPGTVNTHNHSFQSLLRGIGDDLPFLVWRDQALYRYSPRLGAEDMATAALFAFGEMLLHGVTTVCDFYYLNAQGNEHASATIEAARRLGIRIVLARCFYDWDGAPAVYRETIPQAIA